MAGVDWLDRLASIKRADARASPARRDVGATPEMAQQIAERIAGGELEVLDDASHLSVAEVPQRFTQRVRGFVDRVGGV